MEAGPATPKAEELYREALSPFENGRYQEAERRAAEAMTVLTQTTTAQPTATRNETQMATTVVKVGVETAEGGTAEALLGFAILLTPVVLVALAVLYIRRRKRKRREVSPPAAMPIQPPSKYCLECGREIPLEADFCKYCGAEQKT